MKKTFLLLFGLVSALCANADTEKTLYSWSSDGSTVSETGGTVVYTHGDLDYWDCYNDGPYTSVSGVDYYCLDLIGNGEYMGQGDATDQTGYLKFTLNDALKEGDKITITAFRQVTYEDMVASVYIKFGGTGSSAPSLKGVEGTNYWPNIQFDEGSDYDYDNDGFVPKSYTYTVPASAAGMNVINMSEYVTDEDNNDWIFISSVKITRTESEGAPTTISCAAGYINTFCYPYTVTADGATFYKFLGVKDGYVYGEEVTGELEAGFPYLFVPTGSQINLTRTDADEAYTGEKNSNGLYGNLGASKQIRGHQYMLFSKVGLQYCTTLNYNTVKQYGCYVVTEEIPDLSESTSTAKSVRLLSVEDEGTATGIADVQTASSSAAVKYSITGQRVSTLQKGQVYITNGKKYIAK